jgi:soluble lytic murein transglycosylase-like protein
MIAPARISLLFAVLAFSAIVCANAQASKAPQPGRATVKVMVKEEAVRIGVPISLALAVAKVESNFSIRAESTKGARGVMQVMPATALGEYAIHPDMLWQPRINIRLGLHFLKRLLKRYNGRVDLALSFYNGGSAVGDGRRARVIPATKDYVRKVRRAQREFRRELYLRGI